MFRTRQHAVALSLVASLLLAGCGAPAMGTLAPVSKLGKTPVASGVQTVAPSVSVKRGELPATAERQVHVPLVSSLVVAGSAEMSEDEVAELADALGFELLADSTLGASFSKSGLIRSTETGFSLVTTTGIFKKKETTFTLTGSPEALSELSELQNKKALVKGVLFGDTVKVSTLKKKLNLSAIFNAFTKGKVVGHVVGADGKAIADAKISIKSDKGYTFSALSDAEGEYEIKGLEAGKYDVTLAKAGFQSTPKGSFEVKKRHSVKLEASLAPVLATEPEATAAEVAAE